MCPCYSRNLLVGCALLIKVFIGCVSLVFTGCVLIIQGIQQLNNQGLTGQGLQLIRGRRWSRTSVGVGGAYRSSLHSLSTPVPFRRDRHIRFSLEPLFRQWSLPEHPQLCRGVEKTNVKSLSTWYRRARIKRPWAGNLRMQRKRGVGA